MEGGKKPPREGTSSEVSAGRPLEATPVPLPLHLTHGETEAWRKDKAKQTEAEGKEQAKVGGRGKQEGR